MSRHNSYVALVLLLPILSVCATAQSVQTDQQAYCAYLTEQAKAQTDFLRTPTALGSFTQPDTGLPQQLVAGAIAANVHKNVLNDLYGGAQPNATRGPCQRTQ